MKRILTTLLLFLLPLLSLGMGLGQIKVDSSLGEPLIAEIPLLFVQNIALVNIEAQSAPESAYLQAGISLPHDLPALTMTIKEDKQKNPILVVTSAEPVNSPVMSFMLELNWPGGSVFREYTVMLDPPVPVASQENKQIKTVAMTPSTTTTREEILPSQVQSIPVASLATPEAPLQVIERTATYGPIKSGESLQAIALKVKPSQITVNQMMIAIINKNPAAFTHKNINGLASKHILVLPNLSEIQQLSVKSAEAAVIAENQQWRELKQGIKTNQARMMSVLPSVPTTHASSQQQPVEKSIQFQSRQDLNLEKNASLRLLASNASSMIAMPKVVPAQLRQEDTALQNKLALAITAVNSLEQQQHLAQIHHHDLLMQTEGLEQQLNSREQTIVKLQTQIAELTHQPVNKTLLLEQQMSTGFSSSTHYLTQIPLINWFILLIFLCLLSIITWLVLKLRQTQQLMLERIKLPASTSYEK